MSEENVPTDGSRGILGSKDRSGGAFQSHSNAHDDTTGEQLLPGLCKCTANWRCDEEHSRSENGTTSSKVEVHRVGEPAAKEGTTNIGCRVDQSDDPEVSFITWFSFRRVETERFWEGEIGTVGSSLIPALDGGTDRADNDSHVELLGMLPFPVDFDTESVLLGLIEDVEVLKLAGVLCNKCTLLKQLELITHAMAVCKVLDLGNKLSASAMIPVICI